MRIKISAADLPLIRFIKRNQLFTACLRTIVSHPQLTKLEAGSLDQVELDCEVNGKDKMRLTQLMDWWEKAERQGISTRLLNRLCHQPQYQAA
ncbi:hypothetical protein K0504_05745 [Neiella marina]|uniref:Uncharacterized protein n=1 Tax=Neiella holothuriorum TaxID=2870530 RepID=A0ABS7EDW8_9GAMM|nr:hypothetical protein [Neiella holothuriorum]MBW8190534.1 hypothetical protein [Neiella holothuriorum]